jgi:hypothetical protein
MQRVQCANNGDINVDRNKIDPTYFARKLRERKNPSYPNEYYNE